MSRTGSAAEFCASISARSSARVRSRSIIRRTRIENLEPTLHVGELGECPVGATLDERLRGPDDAIGVARALRCLEQDFELLRPRDSPFSTRPGIQVSPA